MADREHAAALAEQVAATHRLLLDAVSTCTDAEMAWIPGPTSTPIAFHLWHCGRWADRWAEALTSQPQRWHREGLTTKWGFPSAQGEGDTGMALSDEEAAQLPFKGRDQMATYLRGAFSDLEHALATLDDESILREADDLLGAEAPLVASLLRQLSHASRHLGMIEALRGLQGGHGTATL